jgi:hypothetical protein
MAFEASYLNIIDLMLYQFFGSIFIMYICLFLLIAYCCLKFALPMQPSFIVLAMYTMLFFLVFATPWSKALFAIIIIGLGVLLYTMMAKRFQ